MGRRSAATTTTTAQNARANTNARERERERESTRAFRNDGAIATEREKERLVPIDSPGTNTKLLARI